MLDSFSEPHRHRGHVPAGHPAVGEKALVEDSPLFAGLEEVLQIGVVVDRDESPNVDEAVFLPAHHDGVGEGELLAGDLSDRSFRVSLLALLDEVGVLGEPTGIDHQCSADLVGQLAGLSDVLDADGLARRRVVGDRDDDNRDVLGTDPRDYLVGAADVEVPFEPEAG